MSTRDDLIAAEKGFGDWLGWVRRLAGTALIQYPKHQDMEPGERTPTRRFLLFSVMQVSSRPPGSAGSQAVMKQGFQAGSYIAKQNSTHSEPKAEV